MPHRSGPELTGDFSDPSSYALRAGAIEALRRVALLVAEMRGEGVPRSEVAARLNVSAEKNPLSGEPFEWRESEGAVAFLGPGDTPNRVRLFYY